jgi:hypothetical protein
MAPRNGRVFMWASFSGHPIGRFCLLRVSHSPGRPTVIAAGLMVCVSSLVLQCS